MAYTKGITEERDVRTLQGVAGATINPYRILKGSTNEDEVEQCDSGIYAPVGVSGDCSEVNAATYTTGDPVTVKYAGIVYVCMSGSGSKWDRVMSNAVGKGLKHQNTDGVWVIGLATQAWSDGDIIPVMIDRTFVGDYTLS